MKYVLSHIAHLVNRRKLNMNKLTHFDKNGNAVMVDVSQKNETERIATACSSISLSNGNTRVHKK